MLFYLINFVLVIIDLNEAKKDWLQTAGPYQIKKIADHYGVFEHLFGDAYFTPHTALNIIFESDETNCPVFYGNIIKPADAVKAPNVQFNAEKDSLYTLILTNPDGHLTQKNSEYVHWFM